MQRIRRSRSTVAENRVLDVAINRWLRLQWVIILQMAIIINAEIEMMNSRGRLITSGDVIKDTNESVIISFDHRGILFNGSPKLLFSGSIHYPRSSPEMWPDLISTARDGGLNVIQTYVFWSSHEPQQGSYDFGGNLDLVRFLKAVGEAGLYASLRIGPYINAEWNFGGIPTWLYLQEGVVLRTLNHGYLYAMQNFTSKIVNMMKDEKLFAPQGGPIIMAQIENEFGAFPTNTPAHAYAMWAAKMATKLDTGVPWIMCKQSDAPNLVINTYNGAINGVTFEPNALYKPKMWTEIYTGWFQTYGDPKRTRSVKNLSFEVARFFQSNGSFVNYYMYHGGTNFGRSAGGPFVTTSYDYDAPIDEYGVLKQPKWGHLKELHQVLKLCEPVLLMGLTPYVKTLGPQQHASIFSNGTGSCVAFLSNLNPISSAFVEFNGSTYELPEASVSIFPDCKTFAYNTGMVRHQTNSFQMLPFNNQTLGNSVDSSWAWYFEPVGAWGGTNVSSTCCPRQLQMTHDKTDYLWHITSFEVTSMDVETTLEISSIVHAAHIFVNGNRTVFVTGTHSSSIINCQRPISLQIGQNDIAISSMTVGLQSAVWPSHIQRAGIQGPIILHGVNGGSVNLSSQSWTYQVGLRGEFLEIYSNDGMGNVEWMSDLVPPINRSFIWYKTTFDAPTEILPLALDLISMGKGQAWVNGRSIGRYWPSSTVPDKCLSLKCDATMTTCFSGCGEPSQRWYHVPLSWLKPTGNTLALFEELGGDPTRIKLVARSTGKICSRISEAYPVPLEALLQTTHSSLEFPEVRLECDTGQQISSIDFASFGTPTGTCNNFNATDCHANNSKQVVEQVCLGKVNCAIQVTAKVFGLDPCPYRTKALAVEATCTLTPSLISQR